MTDQPFHGDRPIETVQQDRFDFGALAVRVAQALTHQAADKGFVMGIQGRWGSGKSSLLALIVEHLRKLNDAKVAVVEFRPWLIGDRDQLLGALFEDLAKAVANLEFAGGDATLQTAQEARKVADEVRRFARHLGPIGKLAEIANIMVPGAALFGKILEGIAAAAKDVEMGPALFDQKAKLSKALANFGCRIIVTIDDVDRLEPREVAEVLRLVRSVADFPNVSYLLCYDAYTLGQAIEKAIGVSDGSAYLQKIVQTEIGVPRPESFALRRWFSAELQSFATCNEDRAPQLIHMISETGGRSFDTARNVVRTLDSLRAYWPSLEGRVDLVDLVWLRIIGIASPALYRWIEEYVTDYAALASGRVSIGDAERANMTKQLDAVLDAEGLAWNSVRFELVRHLPGMSNQLLGKEDKRIFARSHQRSIAGDFQNMRLASSSHSRLYFTLTPPLDSVFNEDIAALVSAANKGVNEVAGIFIELNDQIGDTGTSKAERLLDHLSSMEDTLVAQWPVVEIAMGFVNIADELAKDDSVGDWGYPRIWNIGQTLFNRLHQALSENRWETLIKLAFSHGQSLGFVSHMLRGETFAQGFYGNRFNANEQLTSAHIFEEIRKIMLARYAQAGLEQILGRRQSPTILYAWSQAGGREDIVHRVAKHTSDDERFVAFLLEISSTSSTGSDVDQSLSLSLDAIENFFTSPPEVAKRLSRLASSKPPIAGAERIINAIGRHARFDGRSIEQLIELWERKDQAREGPS